MSLAGLCEALDGEMYCPGTAGAAVSSSCGSTGRDRAAGEQWIPINIAEGR
jgi:hypothetical protein